MLISPGAQVVEAAQQRLQKAELDVKTRQEPCKLAENVPRQVEHDIGLLKKHFAERRMTWMLRSVSFGTTRRA